MYLNCLMMSRVLCWTIYFLGGSIDDRKQRITSASGCLPTSILVWIEMDILLSRQVCSYVCTRVCVLSDKSDIQISSVRSCQVIHLLNRCTLRLSSRGRSMDLISLRHTLCTYPTYLHRQGLFSLACEMPHAVCFRAFGPKAL